MPNAARTASHPSDISLLLRVYGEQRWLICDVLPVLREAEQPGAIAELELPAALAYLEMLWSQACRLATQTDAAASLLDGEDPRCSEELVEKARRYHTAVKRLRSAMQARVMHVTAPIGPPLPHQHARR
jgi:hypothetical protein